MPLGFSNFRQNTNYSSHDRQDTLRAAAQQQRQQQQQQQKVSSSAASVSSERPLIPDSEKNPNPNSEFPPPSLSIQSLFPPSLSTVPLFPLFFPFFSPMR